MFQNLQIVQSVLAFKMYVTYKKPHYEYKVNILASLHYAGITLKLPEALSICMGGYFSPDLD